MVSTQNRTGILIIAILVCICVALYRSREQFHSTTLSAIRCATNHAGNNSGPYVLSEPHAPHAACATTHKAVTVWIYTTITPDHASFEEAFCGFQRLALRSAFVNIGPHVDFQFVHPHNVRTFLPPDVAAFNVTKADPQLLEDCCKYSILSRFGGVWLSPNTVVVQRVLDLFDAMRSAYDAYCKTQAIQQYPFVMLSGYREASSAYQTAGVPNDSFLVCERGNPAIQAIARVLERMLIAHPSHSSYAFSRQAPKMLLRYSTPSDAGAVARSICVLGEKFGGVTDACGRCIQLDTLFAKNYQCQAAKQLYWLSLDERSLLASRFYGWLVNLDEQAILHGDMWISQLYNRALHSVDGTSSAIIHGSEHPLSGLWKNQ